MMKILTLLGLIPMSLFGQVGINTSAPQAPLHIDGAKDNNDAVPTGSAIYNDVIINNKGNIGVGNIAPKTKLDLRTANNSYDNSIGIGYTAQSAAQTGAGALRYVPVNGGNMQYSDGVKWLQLQNANITKANLVARILNGAFTPPTQFAYNTNQTVINFDIVNDNTNSFNANTGVFTIPRDGVYLITFGYDFVNYWINTGSSIEVRFVQNGNFIKKCRRSFSSYGNSNTVTNARQSQAGGSCVGALSFAKGDTFYVTINQTTYNGNLSMRLSTSGSPTSPDAGFNHLTILEQ